MALTASTAGASDHKERELLAQQSQLGVGQLEVDGGPGQLGGEGLRLGPLAGGFGAGDQGH